MARQKRAGDFDTGSSEGRGGYRNSEIRGGGGGGGGGVQHE